jgi:stearoyl-CoA 9-desaturase NADPH oxidoreductase
MTTAAPARRSLRDRLLQVAELVATPLVPDDYVDLLDPLRHSALLRARVVEVRRETADAATLVLRPGRTWRGHEAGQWVRVGVDVDGVRHWRTYSLTSVPGAQDLSITVKAVPDGLVSNHLVRRTEVGALLQLDQAGGDFVLPAERPRKALFVTAGSGITPVLGMVRTALAELPDVVWVHSDRTADDVICGEEVRALAGVRLVERHTDADGVLAPGDLLDLVPDLAERDAWACGPAGLLDALEQWWPTDRLRTERFRAAVVATGDGGAVSFSRTGTTVDADGGTSLLDTGEAAGVLMPSGCRMGICFGCVLPLREGAVRDLRTGAVTTAAPGDGVLVQTCVSAAAGSCDLDV